MFYPDDVILTSSFIILVQLLHDMLTMRGAITKYANLSASCESQLKEVEDRAASFDRHCMEAIKRESKLKEEMATLRKSYDSWIVEKDGVLAQEHTWVADVEAQLDQNEILLWLVDAKAQVAKDQARVIKEQAKATEDQAKATDERAKAADERATSTTTRVVEYKDFDDFVNDAIEAKKGATSSGLTTTRIWLSKPTWHWTWVAFQCWEKEKVQKREKKKA